MKAAIITLGCKVNQYESQEMKCMLTNNGYLVVDAKDNADIYIINSCTVTAESTRKTRRTVRHCKSLNPNACVVLTGCVPQAFPEEATSVQEADIILGNKNNRELISSLKKWFNERETIINIAEHSKSKTEKYSGIPIEKFEGHTRAFVKIQDGCNKFCSYCAIPYARGRSRSKPLEELNKEIEVLSLNGFKEVVFVGIDLSSYGKDFGGCLTDAVSAAQKIDGIKRIRLGSLDPDDFFKDGNMEKMASCTKLCPQFHLSLQSGSDSVLKRMNRHYNTDDYKKIADYLRKSFPDAAITTDIIVGFPGETKEEFNETIEFVKKIRFEKVHVFPFSSREGTKAAKMDGQLTNKVKTERANELTEICENIRLEIFKTYVGKKFSVLFEAPKNGWQNGYTENYTPVKVKSDRDLNGIIADVTIDFAEPDCCVGHLN